MIKCNKNYKPKYKIPYLCIVKAKKNILAFLLFFTYSISLLHAMTPHSHEFEHPYTQEQINFEKLVDDHSSANNISHLGHEDENLFDLIICIFSHTPHSDEFDNQIAQDNVPVNLDTFHHLLPVIYFWLDNSVEEDTTKEIAITPYVNHYQFDYFTQTDLRGPPAFLV